MASLARLCYYIILKLIWFILFHGMLREVPINVILFFLTRRLNRTVLVDQILYILLHIAFTFSCNEFIGNARKRIFSLNYYPTFLHSFFSLSLLDFFLCSKFTSYIFFTFNIFLSFLWIWKKDLFTQKKINYWKILKLRSEPTDRFSFLFATV